MPLKTMKRELIGEFKNRLRRDSAVMDRVGLTPSRLFAATLLLGVTSVAVSQSPTMTQQGPELGGEYESVAESPFQGGGSQVPQTALAGAVPTSPIAKVAAAGDMIGFSHSDASGTQTITIVHTGKAWMGVYHIDRSGTIRLVSSRPLGADFSLQLNATSPLPDEILQMGRR